MSTTRSGTVYSKSKVSRFETPRNTRPVFFEPTPTNSSVMVIHRSMRNSDLISNNHSSDKHSPVIHRSPTLVPHYGLLPNTEMPINRINRTQFNLATLRELCGDSDNDSTSSYNSESEDEDDLSHDIPDNIASVDSFNRGSTATQYSTKYEVNIDFDEASSHGDQINTVSEKVGSIRKTHSHNPL